MTSQNNIKVYLVGGAVRDKVLGRASKDLDFVVVGATRGYMECLGFDQVGADFPVFLHPKSKDEFALARMERKTAEGYKGFECQFNTNVTLEDDLVRRDLTMNAMAIEVDAKILETGEMKLIGDIIDPYNGQEDARNGILHHTSDAFEEDPLRVLRTCRFAARYNFEIAFDTISLMQDIVASGEMNALPMERVFAEFQKAMMEDHPDRFFHYMNQSDAYELYFAELCNWTNEGLEFGISIGATFEERVVMLLSDVDAKTAGKLLTEIKAPNHIIDAATWFGNLTCLIEDAGSDFDEPTTKGLWKAINKVNGWRSLDKLKEVAHLHLYWGEDKTYTALRIVMIAVTAGSKVGFDDLDPKTRDSLVGKEIGEAISQRRLEVLEELNLFPS